MSNRKLNEEIISNLKDAQVYGINTMLQLDDQRRLLENNIEKTDKIQKSLYKSNKIIRSMSGTFNRIMKKKRYADKISGYEIKNNNNKINYDKSICQSKSNDDALEKISESLEHLKMISQEIGKELNKQNEMLNKHTEQIDNATYKTRSLSSKILNLL